MLCNNIDMKINESCESDSLFLRTYLSIIDTIGE